MRKQLYLTALTTILITLAVAQTGEQRRTVVVNGQSGQIIVYEINGRSFVDLESLARIANGTLSFQENQIVLTIPSQATSSAQATSTEGPPANSQPANVMTPGFMKAALQTLAATKQWTDALAYAAQNGVPGNGSRLVSFHDRAMEALGIAKVDASSNADQDAFQLLNNQVNFVQSWNDTLIAQRRSMNTGQYSMTPNSMANDPAYQKIIACTKFLGVMISNGQFQDDGSCH